MGMIAHVKFNELLARQEVELRKRDPKLLKGDREEQRKLLPPNTPRSPEEGTIHRILQP